MGHEPSTASSLHLGWIPYWNLLPLRYELQRVYRERITWNLGVPTQINALLAQGEVAAAPCSSICLLRYPQLEVALPLGIAARGAVRSVYIGYGRGMEAMANEIRQPAKKMSESIRQLRAAHGDDARAIGKALWLSRAEWQLKSCEAAPGLKLTNQSATSATLARIFYRIWFGDVAYEGLLRQQRGICENHPSATFELLIGDEALLKRHSFYGCLDLGQLWQDMTGMPFVYAIWQCQKPLSPGWQKRIQEVAHLAQARMQVEPSLYAAALQLPTQGEVDLKSYWQIIQYRLGADEMRGMLLFLSMAAYFIADRLEDHALRKIMRWQQQSGVMVAH